MQAYTQASIRVIALQQVLAQGKPLGWRHAGDVSGKAKEILERIAGIFLLGRLGYVLSILLAPQSCTTRDSKQCNESYSAGGKFHESLNLAVKEFAPGFGRLSYLGGAPRLRLCHDDRKRIR